MGYPRQPEIVTASAATRGYESAGYAHADYAASLAEFAQPLHLERSDGWLLRRAIKGTPYCDAMGPYPLFFCRNWGQLGEDLSGLTSDLVSVVLVTDPFADVDAVSLSGRFDRVVRFKEHYVAELDQPREKFVRTSHRATARRALRSVAVEVCERPWDHLDDWLRLFANLSRRHSISGLRAFSRQAFETQLRIPGLVMFQASAGDEVVGLDLWYVQGDAAYGHLAAFSELGYKLRASYATKWTMLGYFSGRVRRVDLTGPVGRSVSRSEGLAAFKSGWSTATRPVYLCGRILQPDLYEELSRRQRAATTDYFPAYRDGELA
jgi:hypothetical protein